ncbi:TD and POZ domain-containing protein 2 [Trichonephila inaurata madagascariensis]|uniref:TD and POZ domain-containing protein 2 n=1 Tax=Trichonephila inaurata madagascariensis TaxID=2747483 RepID=A0A8X6YIL1_9ARAC|nr:TD and POZ domain-containing protein 2 [Trichonephila inaurata madagascariensis]
MARNDTDNESWTTFLWNIENYSYFGHIRSPAFEVNSIEEFSWNIELFHTSKWKNILANGLNALRVRGSQSFVVEYDLAILAEDGSVLQLNERKRIYVSGQRCSSQLNLPEAVRSLDTLRVRCRVRRMDGMAVIPVTYFARTLLSVKKRNFLWDIERFSSLEPGQKVTHTIRSHVKGNEMTLSIQVNKDGKIMIFMDSYEQKIKFLKLQLFIMDTNGSKVECGRNIPLIPFDQKSPLCALRFTKKCLLQDQHLYLKKEVLSLYCECSWQDGSPSTRTIERIDFGISSPFFGDEVSAKSCPTLPEVRQCDKILDLKEDLECLYAEGILSDVKLRTSSQTFHAHKAILSARSPVFRAMFQTDMKEKIQECVDVPDLEDDTVRQMLLYVYTNALEDLQWESAMKLYATADKYEIASLKNKCSSFLMQNLCPNNVCDVLVLADMHGDGDLKEDAQNYTRRHEEDVYPSEEWKVFAKNNSTLAVETMLLKWNKH